MSNCLNSKELTWNGSDLGNITQFLANLISFNGYTEGVGFPIKSKLRVSGKSTPEEIVIEPVESEIMANTILAIDELKPYFHVIPTGYHKCTILNNRCIIYQNCEILQFSEALSRYENSFPTFRAEMNRIKCFCNLMCLDDSFVMISQKESNHNIPIPLVGSRSSGLPTSASTTSAFACIFDIKTNNEINNKIDSTFRKFGADMSMLNKLRLSGLPS